MTCYKPIGYGYLVDTYYHDEKTDEHYKYQRKLFFDEQIHWHHEELDKHLKNGTLFPVPCGKCIGCLLEKSSQWATRSTMEAKNWQNNCFVTLTYDNEHLPKNRSLRKKDYQLFLKRLRKNEQGYQEWIRKDKKEKPIRYFIAGEYGPATRRPHRCTII